MVIKRSSAREVTSLLQDLERGPEAAREAAVARLSVIGTRAVEGLLALAGSTPAGPSRLAALAALEAIGDPRAEDISFHWLHHGEPATAAAAGGVLRRLLDSPRGTDILDQLTATVLDLGRSDGVRVAALDALRDMPVSVTGALRKRLSADGSATVRAAAGASALPAARPTPLEVIERAAAHAMPGTPGELRAAVAEAGIEASLPTLHRLIVALRAEEDRAGTAEAVRQEWTAVRGAAHLALAQRGSTVALYDLRETIERAAEAPVELLAAVGLIGDARCLEAIAAAHARLAGAAGGDGWWREHLASAFREIAQRVGLTDRHAVAKRIKARWPDSAAALLPRRDRQDSGLRSQDSEDHA